MSDTDVLERVTILRNWFEKLRILHREEWDIKSHEMNSYEIAEHQGYATAIEDIIVGLTKVDILQKRPLQKYIKGQNVWSYLFGEINECTVLEVYWDIDLKDYRLSLLRKDGSMGKISLGQSKVYASNLELLEAQTTYWNELLVKYSSEKLTPEFKGEVKGFSSCCSVHSGTKEECYKAESEDSICSKKQEKSTDSDSVSMECMHENDGLARFTFPIKYKCKKCGGFY